MSSRGLARGDPNDAKVLRARYEAYAQREHRAGYIPERFKVWLEEYEQHEVDSYFDELDYDLCYDHRSNDW